MVVTETTTDVELLAELSLFALAPRAELLELAESAWWVDFAQGEVVYTRGDEGNSSLLLVEGRMQAKVGRADATPHSSDIWPAEILGEAALFGEQALRSATVVAMTDCRAIELTRPYLEQLSGTEVLAILQRHLILTLSRRLRTTDLAIRKAWQADHAFHQAHGKPRSAARRKTPTLRERLAELIGGIR